MFANGSPRPTLAQVICACLGMMFACNARASTTLTTLTSQAYGLVLDASGASITDGASVIEWQPNDGRNQQWALSLRADGETYDIVNANSGKCLDVVNGSTDNGALLQQWTCWGGSNQGWRLAQQASGAYAIIGVGSNKCIDAPLGITQAGVRTQIWDCGGAPNQQWVLTPPNTPTPSPTPGSTPTPTPTPTPSPTPTPGSTPALPADFSYNIGATRGGPNPVFVRPNMYDYAPALINENGLWRMWWCASVDDAGGDHIFHAEAESLDGPWHAHGSTQANTADDVFQPTYNAGDWDGQDTCDPSVLQIGATYYLYYGGFPIANTPPTQVTAVGLATGSDGLTFIRVQATPIIAPARSVNGLPNTYGAGQPAAIYVDNMFYLAYTDTSGVGSDGPGATSGAGIYVLRASDPTFQSGVEELGAGGFAPYSDALHTQTPIIKAYTIDWAYSDAHDRFFMVWNDSNNGLSRIYVFDHALQMLQDDLTIAGVSDDGPGIAALPNKHLPAGDTCNTVNLDVLRAVGDGTGNTGPYSWDLGHAGVTLDASFSCF